LNVIGFTDPNLALQHFADGGNSSTLSCPMWECRSWQGFN
jgi:hypothetical protein